MGDWASSRIRLAHFHDLQNYLPTAASGRLSFVHERVLRACSGAPLGIWVYEALDL